jgi:hypothetical protein
MEGGMGKVISEHSNELREALRTFEACRINALKANKAALLAGGDVGTLLHRVRTEVGRLPAIEWAQAHGLGVYDAGCFLALADARERVVRGDLDLLRAKRLLVHARILPGRNWEKKR